MILQEKEAYLGRVVLQESVKEITNSRQARNEKEEKAKEKEARRNVKKEKEVKKPRRTTKTA